MPLSHVRPTPAPHHRPPRSRKTSKQPSPPIKLQEDTYQQSNQSAVRKKTPGPHASTDP